MHMCHKSRKIERNCSAMSNASVKDYLYTWRVIFQRLFIFLILHTAMIEVQPSSVLSTRSMESRRLRVDAQSNQMKELEQLREALNHERETREREELILQQLKEHEAAQMMSELQELQQALAYEQTEREFQQKKLSEIQGQDVDGAAVVNYNEILLQSPAPVAESHEENDTVQFVVSSKKNKCSRR